MRLRGLHQLEPGQNQKAARRSCTTDKKLRDPVVSLIILQTANKLDALSAVQGCRNGSSVDDREGTRFNINTPKPCGLEPLQDDSKS